MADKTSIEWTDATWNPVRGCAIVSKGCTNCYAMRQARRASGPGRAYDGLTKLTKGGPVWTGEIRLVPELLEQPLAWQRPRRIFVNSMSDLFHEDVPAEFIYRLWCVMAAARRHRFQILTKRAARMREVLTGPTFRSQVLDNVWLGVSVEDQAAADERIPQLLATPAAVRWISAEPLLGPIDLLEAWGAGLAHRGDAHHPKPFRPLHGLDWVVAGGESGPGARPMHPDWARMLRDWCAAAGVPFFFKQWGSWRPRTNYYGDDRQESWIDRSSYGHGVQLLTPGGDEWVVGDPIKGGRHDGQPPSGTWVVQRLDKKSAGRALDGRTHDEYPA